MRFLWLSELLPQRSRCETSLGLLGTSRLQVAHGQQIGSPISCGDVLVHHAIALSLGWLLPSGVLDALWTESPT